MSADLLPARVRHEALTYGDLLAVVDAAGIAVDNPHTKRAYARAWDDFVYWFRAQGQPGIGKATLDAYRAALLDAGAPPSSVNQALAAVKRLLREAHAYGVLSDDALASALGAGGTRQSGERSGNWLTLAQAQALLRAPDVSTLRGLRDRAILAVLVGTGLRRSECAALTVAHLQQREGRWVILDLVGKGNKTRSVAMPSWCKAALDAWLGAAGITTGPLWAHVRKGGQLGERGLTGKSIADVVHHYAQACGYGVAAHDLRRTFAQLARRGGAALEQISLSLGHASIETTQRYLGTALELHDAPADRLGLHL